MPEFSVKDLPEVFVSSTDISKAVYDAVERGELRKLASRLYTRNLDDDPERLVLKNWHFLISSYYPDAIITDRTAMENRPAEDGSVFIVSDKKRPTELPGLTFKPRKGAKRLESDRPFIGGAHLASVPRAYLENMRISRPPKGEISRTLSCEEIEEKLDTIIRRQGEEGINKLRDDARKIAPALGLEDEFEKLNTLIGALLGTREDRIKSTVGKARIAGQPYDPDRARLFEELFSALRETMASDRQAPKRDAQAITNLAFFEAYFSNFIEGTEFTVEEAEDIVFNGAIPAERPDDAHDVLGTFRIVSDLSEMRQVPTDFDALLSLLRRRHHTIMEMRPEKKPGQFKDRANRAGATEFVAPELVTGTLEFGFGLLEALSEPFQRAVFMSVLTSEVHPFADGNGRIARVMMNAELVAAEQERIIIPTAYRTDYLGALKAFSHNGRTEPLIKMLTVAQNYAASIDWSSLEGARQQLETTNAFAEGEDAKLKL